METRQSTQENNAARATARWEHLPILAASLAVLAASAALRIDPQGRVALPFTSYTLPEVCFYHRFTGCPCPGCGLTRSFIAVAHLRLGSAFAYHAAGPFLFALIGIQVPARLYALLRPPAATRLLRQRWVARYVWAMIALSLASWVWRTLEAVVGG